MLQEFFFIDPFEKKNNVPNQDGQKFTDNEDMDSKCFNNHAIAPYISVSEMYCPSTIVRLKKIAETFMYC